MSPREESNDDLFQLENDSPQTDLDDVVPTGGLSDSSTYSTTPPLFSSSSSSVNSSSSLKKAVKFGKVQIREYNRIPGDHPETRVGPPLTISWEFLEQPAKSIDEYEETRPTKRVSLRLSSITRKNLLRNVFEVEDAAMEAAEREARKIQRQREKTASQGKVSTVVESAFQSMKRKIQRRVSKDSFMFDSYAAASGSMLPLGVY